MEELQNVHNGHRKRMRELVERVGLENLDEIQALEFTLSYIIPRKDTNIIAHDLLKKFGTFANALSAPEKEIEEIDNMGVESAKMLSQLKNVFQYYKISKQKAFKVVKNVLDLNKYFKNLLEDFDKEYLYAIAINDKSEIVAVRCLSCGSNKLVTVDKREIADFAFTNKVRKIALGHNHPLASSDPSKTDDECTTKIISFLNAIGIELVDHVIVGNDGTFSFKEIKKFDFDELK